MSTANLNAQARQVFTKIFLSKAYGVHRKRMTQEKDCSSAEQYWRILPGADIPAWEYLQAKKETRRLAQDVLAAFDVYFLLVMPPPAITAPCFGMRETSFSGVSYSTREAINTLTSLWSVLGLPVISIPAEEVNEMPCGLQLLCMRPANTSS